MYLGLGLGLIPSTARRRAWSPASLPSISGLTVHHLWLPGVGTSTRLREIYGTGHDLVATGSPVYVPNYYPSGRPAIQFDASTLFNASGVSTSRNKVGVAGVWSSPSGANQKTICGWGSDGDAFLDFAGSIILPCAAGSAVGSGYCPTQQDTLVIAEANASLYLAGAWDAFGGGSNASNISLSGFTVGARAPGTSATKLDGYFGGCMLFDTPSGLLSGAQIQGIILYLRSLIFQPTKPKVFVASGNSIMSGVGLSYANSWYGQIVSGLGSSWSGFSVAVPGATVQNCTDYDPYRLDPTYSASQTATVTLLGGEPSNTINGGTTGANAVTAVEAWATARKAAGFKAIVTTCPDRTDYDSGKETARAAYNTAMRAAYPTATANSYVFLPTTGGANALLDIDAITAGALQGDGVHPNATRAAAFGSAAVAAIQILTP